MMLPYFEVNGKMYFSKEQLDEWINDVSRKMKEYNTVDGFVV